VDTRQIGFRVTLTQGARHRRVHYVQNVNARTVEDARRQAQRRHPGYTATLVEVDPFGAGVI
jgi:hypothetical protein